MSSPRVASVSSLGENCLSKREKTRVPQRASREAERSERALKSMGKRQSCNKGMSSKCCEHEVISGQLMAYRSRIGEGEERQLASYRRMGANISGPYIDKTKTPGLIFSRV